MRLLKSLLAELIQHSMLSEKWITHFETEKYQKEKVYWQDYQRKVIVESAAYQAL